MSTDPSTTWRAERFSQNSSAPPIFTVMSFTTESKSQSALAARIEFLGTVSGAGNYFSGGTVTMNGAFRPGNGPGVVSFGGDLVLADTSRLFIELGGTTAGSQYDRLSVGGNASVDGALDVARINGFQPQTGNVFEIISAGNLSGSFASVSGQDLGGGLLLNPITTATSLSLLAAVPGDANLDKTADFADLGILLNNYNVSGFSGVAQWNAGDFNDDHIADFADLGILLNNYNQTVPRCQLQLPFLSPARWPSPHWAPSACCWPLATAVRRRSCGPFGNRLSTSDAA